MVQPRKITLPIWLILGLFLAFLLRLPSLFEPYSYGDECIYLTLGQAIRRGFILYREIHDNKPPLLYLLAAVSGNLFWFRSILLVWSLATILLFYRLGQTLFPKKEKLVQVSTLAFVFLSSSPWFEGGVANAEQFMLLPIFAGILLVFCGKKLIYYFLGGILFSLAALFKVPAAFDFAAVLIFLLIIFKKKNYKLLITNYFLLLLGFSAPIIITLLYFWSQGALNQYLFAAFFQNLPYLSSWQGGTQAGSFNQLLLIRFGILFVFLVSLWWTRKKINPNLIFVFSWFGFSLFAATLSERPYPHYLVQALPSLSFLIATFFSRLKAREHLFASISLAFFLLAFFYFQFWLYPFLTPYKNFLLFATKKWSQEKYFSSFGENVPRNYKLSEFLTSSTQKNEKIFIWGDSPCVYALARRLPVGRYTVAYHIIDFDGYQETIRAIEKEMPRFIIDLGNEKKPFPELKQLLLQKYSFFKEVNGAKIFIGISQKMI